MNVIYLLLLAFAYCSACLELVGPTQRCEDRQEKMGRGFNIIVFARLQIEIV